MRDWSVVTVLAVVAALAACDSPGGGGSGGPWIPQDVADGQGADAAGDGAAGDEGPGVTDSGPETTEDVGADVAFPSCTDQAKNGGETDVDCGGPCGPCGPGKGCAAPADCASGLCTAGACAVAATCDDGVKSPGETDMDCGGPCPPCAVGLLCKAHADCLSETCIFGVCDKPTCDDEVRNQGETSTDCGGPKCPGCADGATCAAAADCLSGACEGAVCVSCADGKKNGGETGKDCGGPCGPCADGQPCGGAVDCLSGTCEGGVCCAPNACGTCGAPPTEVCNGKDDDCDGATDDPAELTGAPVCSNQAGVCSGALSACQGAAGWTCGATEYAAHSTLWQGSETLCDGADNDCDGATDEHPDCAACSVGETVMASGVAGGEVNRRFFAMRGGDRVAVVAKPLDGLISYEVVVVGQSTAADGKVQSALRGLPAMAVSGETLYVGYVRETAAGNVHAGLVSYDLVAGTQQTTTFDVSETLTGGATALTTRGTGLAFGYVKGDTVARYRADAGDPWTVLQVTTVQLEEGALDLAVDAAGGVHAAQMRSGKMHYRALDGSPAKDLGVAAAPGAIVVAADGVPHIAWVQSGNVIHRRRDLSTADAWVSKVTIGAGRAPTLAFHPSVGVVAGWVDMNEAVHLARLVGDAWQPLFAEAVIPGGVVTAVNVVPGAGGVLHLAVAAEIPGVGLRIVHRPVCAAPL